MILREDGLQVFARAPGWARESTTPFTYHFGRRAFWWLVDDEREEHFDTFCEAWWATR